MISFRRKLRGVVRWMFTFLLIGSLLFNLYFLQGGKPHLRFRTQLYRDLTFEKFTLNQSSSDHVNNDKNPVTSHQNKSDDTDPAGANVDSSLQLVTAKPLPVDLQTFNFSWKSPLRHFFNVCIVDTNQTSASARQMLARVSIYDSNYHHHALKRILWKTYVHAVEMENYWVLDFEKQDPPVTSSRNWTWMDATAYFVPFFRDSNHIFATLHETGPLTFGQILHGAAYMPPSYRNLSKVLISKSVNRLKNDTKNALRASGFQAISSFSHIMQQTAPVCFRNAIFGAAPAETPQEIDMMKTRLQKQFGIRSKCESLHVLLLQRAKTREIVNANEIAAAIEKQHHVKVVIENFDSKSFASQLEAVQCSTVFIGVQGAGLSWYRFLPKKATLLELFYDNWGAKFVHRASINRPDIHGRTLHCATVTDESVWSYYAKKWFHHTGDLNDDIRQKIAERSKENPSLFGSVWKDSNVNCSVHDVIKQLPKRRFLKGKKVSLV